MTRTSEPPVDDGLGGGGGLPVDGVPDPPLHLFMYEYVCDEFGITADGSTLLFGARRLGKLTTCFQ